MENKTKALEKGFQPPQPLPWGAGLGQGQAAGFGSSSAGRCWAVPVEVGLEGFGKEESCSPPWCCYSGHCCVPKKDTERLLSFQPAFGKVIQGCWWD